MVYTTAWYAAVMPSSRTDRKWPTCLLESTEVEIVRRRMEERKKCQVYYYLFRERSCIRSSSSREGCESAWDIMLQLWLGQMQSCWEAKRQQSAYYYCTMPNANANASAQDITHESRQSGLAEGVLALNSLHPWDIHALLPYSEPPAQRD